MAIPFLFFFPFHDVFEMLFSGIVEEVAARSSYAV